MKKYIYFLLCTLGIAACQKTEEFISTEGMVMTRSITPSVSPIFDWWDTTNISLLGMTTPVVLPWYNGANTQIPYYLLEDYQPTDGWEMVYNYCIDGIPGEASKNYLIFYNKFTGILRIFYHNNNQVVPATISFWRFEVTAPTSMLNATGVISVPMSERIASPHVYVSNLTSVPSKSISMGWNCFDLELAYDDQIMNTNARFNINVYNTIKNNIKLNGDLKLETDGTIITTASSSYPAWMTNASKAAGSSSKDFVQKLLKKTSLSDKISSIISGGVSALVTNGAIRLLGSFIGKKDNNYNSHVKLTSTGKIELEGEMETLNLPNISALMNNPMPGAQKQSTDYFLPSYDAPLGVWALEEIPKIYICETQMWRLDHTEEVQKLSDAEYVGNVQQEELLYYYKDSIKIKINPKVLECVEKYEIEAECVWTVQSDSYADYIRTKSSGVNGACQIYTDSSILLSSCSLPLELKKTSSCLGKSGYVYYSFHRVPMTETEYRNLYQGTTSFELLQDFQSSRYPLTEAIKKGELVFQVTITLYPKSPYDQTPIVLMRTYPIQFGGTDNQYQPERWRMLSFPI